MRADRLFSIVLLLQQYRQMTAGELAEQLEVSPRTILRDMEALSGAGIPVVAERGAGGGWSLLGQYRTDLTGLNEAELQSLFVTKPTRILADLKLERAAEGAMLKLLAALPSAYRRGVEQARQKLYIDPTGWGRGERGEEAVPLLQVLQEAVWQERRIFFSYARHGCDPVERTVDPLGLVAKGSAWYLVAGVEGDIRSYRVSRIQRAEIREESYERPSGFDLAAFWEQSSAEFRSQVPQYRMLARVHPEAVPFLPYGGRFARVMEAGEPDERGWVPVTIRFDIEEAARDYALSFGARLEVIEPEDLRQQVIAAAKEVVAFYAGHSRPSQRPIS